MLDDIVEQISFEYGIVLIEVCRNFRFACQRIRFDACRDVAFDLRQRKAEIERFKRLPAQMKEVKFEVFVGRIDIKSQALKVADDHITTTGMMRFVSKRLRLNFGQIERVAPFELDNPPDSFIQNHRRIGRSAV